MTSLAVGVAYVFGMVAPLFLVALFWDGRQIGSSRWLAAPTLRLRVGPQVRVVPVASFTGGLLLVAMGVAVGVLAVTGPDMATRGWQATMSGDAQHYGHAVTAWISLLPGWLSALGVFVSLAGLVVVAVRQVADEPAEQPPAVAAGPRSASMAQPPTQPTGQPSDVGLRIRSGPVPASRKGR